MGEKYELDEYFREEVLEASGSRLDALVGKHICGFNDMSALLNMPSINSFDQVMNIMVLFKTVIPESEMWPFIVTRNNLEAPRLRAYIVGFGIPAYEIECGPHAGPIPEPTFWYGTKIRRGTIAYGPDVVVAGLRACVLLANKYKFIQFHSNGKLAIIHEMEKPQERL